MTGHSRPAAQWAWRQAVLHDGFRDQLRWSLWTWIPFDNTADKFSFHDKCAREYRQWGRVLHECACGQPYVRAVDEYGEFDRMVGWHMEFGHFGGPLRVDHHLATPFVDTIVMS